MKQRAIAHTPLADLDSLGAQVYREELTPLAFLERSGSVHADRIAVVDGNRRYTYRDWRVRARQFASALRKAGMRKGDRIAFLALNSEQLLLAHFAVPMAGGVLVAINTRLSAAEVAYIVAHSGARRIFYSCELQPLLADLPGQVTPCDIGSGFEGFLATGNADPIDPGLMDEEEMIAIDYTSGTTGHPKGVMYTHRSAALNALAMIIHLRLSADSRYLWTLPMFHCNGWCITWALAAVGATSFCIPRVDPARVWELLDQDGITHYNGAPTVQIILANDPSAHRLSHPVTVTTGGAPPSPTLIARLAELNLRLEHVYGLTETYAPFTINEEPPGAETLSRDERSRLKARQGVPHILAGRLRVVDDAMHDVPADGATMGEVVMRGNIVTRGYYRAPELTARAFAGGWFHSGDVAVMHADGSIELRDRKKDIIISGGENISTIEVEQTISTHPSVMECAVIAIPDEKWGEVPKAFVATKPGRETTAEEIIEHCRARMAHFKCPAAVEFEDLPKTSTGKVQKYVLREREWQGYAKRIN
ncbi:MAG: acyl-CoA synthetase [Chloroflexi bacterium]|nr:MAG: acyl-CoA synthetase [Chloroflexota bacterium]